MDKVQKIREEVERRMKAASKIEEDYKDIDEKLSKKAQLKSIEYHSMLMFIDSMQEEPVSDDLEEEIGKELTNQFGTHYDDDATIEITAFDYVNIARHFVNWQKAKDESTTEDLGEYINELSKQFPEVSFAKLSRIAVRVAKWQKENLWKPADGDDLPEIDIEVIALIDNGKVVFAHRPDPKGWDAKSIITEKVEHYTPETYDKGGWNIPDIKFWLDVELPKEIEL